MNSARLGHHIASEDATGNGKVPHSEHVAPDLTLPRIEIQWTREEAEDIAKLASAPEADPPTEALMRALRD